MKIQGLVIYVVTPCDDAVDHGRNSGRSISIGDQDGIGLHCWVEVDEVMVETLRWSDALSPVLW